MNKKIKTYKASNELEQRIGSGPLDSAAIKRAQGEIDDNEIDFAPMGLEFLERLDSALKETKPETDHLKAIEKKKALISPVMELKANATIFHYKLVGDLAGIMLSFLENITELDKDALSIVRGHHDSLKLILSSKMKGNGGADGKTMTTELNDACNRYYKKKKKQG